MLVGGEVIVPPAEDEIFSITLGEIKTPGNKSYLAARIRIFSYMAMPVYIVIIGADFEGDYRSIKAGAYLKPIKFELVGEDGEPPSKP